ncbi:hypothetical protein GPECTOR_64g88 [Gonium pectorale]|uniref:Uncharacterized protein n=1 Tax=Gonium pectorale TaxID=33097 RepID=A0A150G452_GONPE|nr:hypothetical protein GPECTOR_64g88 [Gonium pectorale]|eukprot:KXZ44669.1 hypothetical protein GPECTOR_64g88 [Gonium pectorale]
MPWSTSAQAFGGALLPKEFSAAFCRDEAGAAAAGTVVCNVSNGAILAPAMQALPLPHDTELVGAPDLPWPHTAGYFGPPSWPKLDFGFTSQPPHFLVQSGATLTVRGLTFTSLPSSLSSLGDDMDGPATLAALLRPPTLALSEGSRLALINVSVVLPSCPVLSDLRRALCGALMPAVDVQVLPGAPGVTHIREFSYANVSAADVFIACSDNIPLNYSLGCAGAAGSGAELRMLLGLADSEVASVASLPGRGDGAFHVSLSGDVLVPQGSTYATPEIIPIRRPVMLYGPALLDAAGLSRPFQLMHPPASGTRAVDGGPRDVYLHARGLTIRGLLGGEPALMPEGLLTALGWGLGIDRPALAAQAAARAPPLVTLQDCVVVVPEDELSYWRTALARRAESGWGSWFKATFDAELEGLREGGSQQHPGVVLIPRLGYPAGDLPAIRLMNVTLSSLDPTAAPASPQQRDGRGRAAPVMIRYTAHVRLRAGSTPPPSSPSQPPPPPPPSFGTSYVSFRGVFASSDNLWPSKANVEALAASGPLPLAGNLTLLGHPWGPSVLDLDNLAGALRLADGAFVALRRIVIAGVAAGRPTRMAGAGGDAGAPAAGGGGSPPARSDAFAGGAEPPSRPPSPDAESGGPAETGGGKGADPGGPGGNPGIVAGGGGSGNAGTAAGDGGGKGDNGGAAGGDGDGGTNGAVASGGSSGGRDSTGASGGPPPSSPSGTSFLALSESLFATYLKASAETPWLPSVALLAFDFDRRPSAPRRLFLRDVVLVVPSGEAYVLGLLTTDMRKRGYDAPGTRGASGGYTGGVNASHAAAAAAAVESVDAEMGQMVSYGLFKYPGRGFTQALMELLLASDYRVEGSTLVLVRFDYAGVRGVNVRVTAPGSVAIPATGATSPAFLSPCKRTAAAAQDYTRLTRGVSPGPAA